MSKCQELGGLGVLRSRVGTQQFAYTLYFSLQRPYRSPCPFGALPDSVSRQGAQRFVARIQAPFAKWLLEWYHHHCKMEAPLEEDHTRTK